MDNIKSEKNENEWSWPQKMVKKFGSKIVEVLVNIKNIGEDDPRRVIHALKVGLTLTIVSLFYYFQTTYDSFGVYAMWAIMTVVVVFEFSVGATIGKGINRGIATLVAGALGVAAHHLASTSGKIGEPIILGVIVFLQAMVSTYIRFFPKIKVRYDYGVLVFILTFALVSVSGFRLRGIIDFAHKRLSTIAIGGCACVIISIVLCPVWAGEDLHNLVASNLEKLGYFLEGFGEEYFRTSEGALQNIEKPFLQGYKSVLTCKDREETLANFARWEPGHGMFMYRHPWKQYLKIGSLIRQCAYRIEALNGYLNTDIKVSQYIREKMQESCVKVSVESGEAMKDLALMIRTMTHHTSSKSQIEKLKLASKNLKLVLKSNNCNEIDLLNIMPMATVASLLMDIVICVEDIAKAVDELATLAKFKSFDAILDKKLVLKKLQCLKLSEKTENCSQVVIGVDALTLK